MRPIIVMQYTAQYADLLAALARKFSEKGYGSVLLHVGASFLPPDKTSTFSAKAFDVVIDLEECLRPRPTDQLGTSADVAARAAAAEAATGIRLLEAIRADRHLGYGFVVGAQYARSRYSNAVTYDQSVDIATRVAAAIQKTLSENSVVAAIGYPASIEGNILLDSASAMGIAVRTPCLTAGGRFTWAADKYYRPIALEQRYLSALGMQTQMPTSVKTPSMARSARATLFIDSFRERTTLKYLLSRFYRLCRREVGNRIKRRGRVYGGYLLGEALLQTFRIWRLSRAALTQKPVLETLESDLPYVFAPLSVEPESTLMAESPSCDNQLAFLDQLAKSLPGGWRLIVKEHPGATAPRSRQFWRQLAAYPNVIVAPMLESGESYMPKAKAVAIIRSTMGMQAAVAGVPVITPHPAYYGAVLPHVFTAPSYQDIEAALKQIAANDLPPLETRIAAAKALLSVLEAGIAVTDASLLKGVGDGKPISEDFVNAIVGDFFASLVGVPAPTQSVPT